MSEKFSAPSGDKFALLMGTPLPKALPPSGGERMYTDNRDRIAEEVKLMHSMHHRRVEAHALKVWADECEKFAGDTLWEIFRQSRMGDRCPTLGQVLEACRARAPKPKNEIPVLTEEQRAKSKRAAVLSMLWMHYRGIYSPELAGVFKLQTGESPGAALKHAMERYPHAIVDRWMDDQKAAGN